MFEFPNGSKYKLLLVDTNILSNITKNYHDEREIFERFITKHKFAPCFSFQSVLEVKNSCQKGDETLYQNFLSLFSLLPCIILFPYRTITNQEIEHIVKGNKIDISKCMNAFSLKGKDDTYNFRIWVENILEELKNTILLEEQENVKVAKEFNAERLLANKRHQRILYPVFEKQFFNNFFYCEEKSLLGKDYNAFDCPAISMMSITKYDRIYNISKRPIGVNDINDIFISAYIPYMDAIIMENHQVELVRQKKNKYKFLENVELFTMKDITNKK